MFAHKWMRMLGAVLLAAVLALGCACCSVAEGDDPVEFTIEVLPGSLTEPGEVAVSLKVANTGSEDMLSPVTLYDPDGNVVTSFGDGGSCQLAAGAFRAWEGIWPVTQSQLDQGEVIYTLKYMLEDENREMVAMTAEAAAPIVFTGEKVDLSVTRTISPEIVRSGNTASVLYELYNSGNVDLTDIRVEEKISKKAQTVASLKAGEKTTMTFTSKIGNADLTSAATVTYKAKDSSKTLKKQVEEAAIPLAKPNLKLELSSPSTGVNIGDAAELVITFINTGNVSYSNVSVSDAKKGEIATNLSIPAGATVTENIEFTLMEKTEFKVTATLPDNTGETKTVTADPLTINVFDPEKTLMLSLNLTCDHETVEQTPADVRFSLHVTNNSNVKAENIAILHADKPITTIPALEPGADITIARDVRISQAGKFRFTASVKDAMSNTVTFDSNTIRLSYAPASPAPTAVVRETVAPPEYVTPAPVTPLFGSVRDVLKNAAMVLGGLLAVALVLFVISSAVRVSKKNKSNAAYDHLELSERRDYNEPGENSEEYDTSAERGERVELPHVKLLKEQIEEMKAATQETEEKPGAPLPGKVPETDGEGGFRISRKQEQQQPKSEPENPIEQMLKSNEASKPEQPKSESENPIEQMLKSKEASKPEQTEQPKQPEQPEQTENVPLGQLIKPRRRAMEPKTRKKDDE